MMTSSHTINLQTYSCKVTFTVTDDLSNECKKIYKKFNIKIDEDDDGENEGLLVSPDIDKYFLLIDLNYLSHNTIAHEIYHATVRITEERDIVDEEAQAWLCGYLSEAIYKFLIKKQFQIKHGG
jgi:hypothetical protein